MEKRSTLEKKDKTYEKVVEKLANINNTLEGILQILSKPENKVMVIFKYVGAGVGALGILSIVEIIRKWIKGG